MKKWLCSVFGYVYDPETDNIPAEMRGAATCRYVEDGYQLACHLVARKYRLIPRSISNRRSGASLEGRHGDWGVIDTDGWRESVNIPLGETTVLPEECPGPLFLLDYQTAVLSKRQDFHHVDREFSVGVLGQIDGKMETK